MAPLSVLFPPTPQHTCVLVLCPMSLWPITCRPSCGLGRWHINELSDLPRKSSTSTGDTSQSPAWGLEVLLWEAMPCPALMVLFSPLVITVTSHAHGSGGHCVPGHRPGSWGTIPAPRPTSHCSSSLPSEPLAQAGEGLERWQHMPPPSTQLSLLGTGFSVEDNHEPRWEPQL